jgi:serine/threonine protein kinase
MLPAADRTLKQYLDEMNGIQVRDRESRVEFGNGRLQLLKWIYCLAVTLKELHDRNIRHRDIKSQNILINGSNILLTDFGISFSVDGLTTAALTGTIGTSQYEPPEALHNQTENPQTRVRTGRLGDVFSLGCVFFEMLSASCRPLLSSSFPVVQGSYSCLCNNETFLSEVGQVREHAGLCNRLPENCRFPGLVEELLDVVTSGMMTAVQRRQSSAAIVDLMQEILARHRVPLLDCCAREPGVEPLDRPLPSTPPLPPSSTLSTPAISPTQLNPTLPDPGLPAWTTSMAYERRGRIRAPRRSIHQDDHSLEAMRKALQTVLSTENITTISFENLYRPVYNVFVKRSASLGEDGYKAILACVDEFVDQQTSEFHSLCSEIGLGRSQHGAKSSSVLDICKCIIRAWDLVNPRLELASYVTMSMVSDFEARSDP